jgi:hypothetical protein
MDFKLSSTYHIDITAEFCAFLLSKSEKLSIDVNQINNDGFSAWGVHANV